MKYHVHHGKVGTYGEIRTTEYRDSANRPLATIQHGTPCTVTLYSKGVAHSRSGPPDTRVEEICLAHLSSLGYTEEGSSTWDLKAYND